MTCVLCGSKELLKILNEFVTDRSFQYCQNCDLIFVPEAEQANPEKEKHRYEQHNNTNLDEGYIRFLSLVVDPVCEMVPSVNRNELQILDYGCGPAASLSRILEQRGFVVKNYDPYFFKDEKVFMSKWDLILSTEVWEHFRRPKIEIEKVRSLLGLNGLIVVMTQLHESSSDFFKDWWYVRDFTHVCFYSKKTFEYLAMAMNLEIVYLQGSVVILRGRA